MPKGNEIPDCPGVPADRFSGRETREYSIRLITSMFGGGVEAGEPDPTFPIRGTSIRGQLQFWWRATRGADYTTHGRLFQRHAEIWGRTEQASPVEIEVRDVQTAAPRSCASYNWNKQARRGQGGWRLIWESPFGDSALPYALFPFQGQSPPSRSNAQPAKLPAQCIANGSFKLRVRFPKSLRQEVETAVWAWVNFGGLGARTRRGCGGLFCEELAPRDVPSLPTWFSDVAGPSPAAVRAWPTLPDRFFCYPQSQQRAIDAWDQVIGLMREFRQDAGLGRNPGQRQNRPGRSRYPEPETVRRVTGRRFVQHARLAHIPDDAFPRAEFGLPIIFHFQGEGEPPDTVLCPAAGLDGQKRERMASPIILKPLALSSGQTIPLVMRLVTPRLTGVDLRQGDSSLPLPPTTVIQDGELATYRDSPLAGTGSGSVLDAFVSFARRKGYEEVTR